MNRSERERAFKDLEFRECFPKRTDETAAARFSRDPADGAVADIYGTPIVEGRVVRHHRLGVGSSYELLSDAAFGQRYYVPALPEPALDKIEEIMERGRVPRARCARARSLILRMWSEEPQDFDVSADGRHIRMECHGPEGGRVLIVVDDDVEVMVFEGDSLDRRMVYHAVPHMGPIWLALKELGYGK